MTDKPVEEMTPLELAGLVTAFREIHTDALKNLGDVLDGWHNIPEARRHAAVQKAMAPLLINPWPLPNDELARLRDRFMERCTTP